MAVKLWTRDKRLHNAAITLNLAFIYGKNMTEYGHYDVAPNSERKLVVITDWNSDEGRARIRRSRYSDAFFRLAHHYEAQMNPFFCSVACMVTVLNTLRLAKGRVPNQPGFDFTTEDGRHIEYKLYSQLRLLNEKTEHIKPKKLIAPSIPPHDPKAPLDPGLNLKQVRDILRVYGAEVEMFQASHELEYGLPVLIGMLKKMLNDPNRLLILNFYGRMKGATTGGHFSVAGAYDEDSDSVLILDAAAHKNPWYWVAAKHLYYAMNTKDGEEFRGYLLVSEAE